MPYGNFFGKLSIFFAANAEPGVHNSIGDTTSQLLIGIIVVLAVMYIIYILYKYILSGKSLKKGRDVKVIEITSVGPGSTVQLLKVSEEYFLIGVTKTQISFLTKVNGELFKNADSEENAAISFEKHLIKIFKSRQNKQEASDENDSK